MIKCKTIEKFNISNYGALKNIERVGAKKEGTLFVGDTFECDEEMAKYLTGGNAYERAFVEVVEVKPKVKDAEFEKLPPQEETEKPKKKTTKKATKSKK